jgi:hypothetical protein
VIHDTLDGFDMDKDYTKDYPQEDVLRGLEETVQTVESTFHGECVWTVCVDLVCDSQYCLYDSLYLFCRSAQSTQEKKEQVWKRTHGEGKPWRSRSQETEDTDSDEESV